MRLGISRSCGDRWLRWIEKLEGNIYHSPEWADMQSTNHSCPLFFHWLDHNQRCVGIAVGIQSWSSIPFIGRLSKRLDFDTYPAVEHHNIDLTRTILRKLLDFAKTYGYRCISINSYMAKVAVPDMHQLGFNPKERMEFILDLTMDEEKLWKALSTHHKRKIKKAKKHDLHIEEASTLDAFKKFSKLQRMSRDRRVKRGEHIGLLDDIQFEELGRRYFDKNLGRVFLMMHQKEAISAAFVSIYADKGLYVYGGSSDKGFGMDAPGLLFWHIFERCRELGCKEFNLGGVPASAVNPESESYGLYRFKAGFGGRQVKCLSGSTENLRPRLDWILEMFKRVLKSRLP
jgi:hypothetical protein